MQENHSFDNYFGTYPTANGTLEDGTTSQLQHVDGLRNNICLPYQGSCLSPKLTTSKNPSNPTEGQMTYEMDYSNNGTGFPTYSGPQSMVYFDYHSIPAYWDYAEEYGLADNYFAPLLTQTTPNRLMVLSGDTPVSANYGPPPYISYYQTIMHQLDDAGVSWGYFDYVDAYGNASNVYPLNYISNRPQQAISDTRNIFDLFQQLSQNSGLPSVTFVNSLWGPQLDEHPPNDPTTGELWVVSIVNHIMKSNYWPTSAIFITYDEGGGFYDHVVPPNQFTIDHGFSFPLQGLGQRVPLLVISPYTKQNFVSHVLMSHLSLSHFIEYNWKLPALSTGIAEANVPLEFFDFSQSPRDPVILTSPVTYPISLQAQSIGIPLTTYVAYEMGFLALTVALLVFLVRRRNSS